MLEQASDSPNKKPFEKERQFHKERWEKESDALANRNAFQKYLDPNTPDLSAEEIRRDEADLDNEYFDKLKHPEAKRSFEQLQMVVHNLLEKRDNPDNKEIRAILFGMGAGMRIPYGVGEVLGLCEMGITAETFDALYGSSASAPLMLYFAAGIKAMRKGAAMVCENLATNRFVNKARGLVGKLINLEMLKKEMEAGDKRLNEEDVTAIRNASCDVNIVVTHPAEKNRDVRTEFLDAKTIPSLGDGVVAAMSIDHVTGKIPTINGISYRDGGFNPMPIEQIIDDYEKKRGKPPTDILVLVNTPFETQDELRLTPQQQAQVNVARQFGSLTQAEKYLLMREELRKSLLYVEDVKKRRGVNVGLVWPPNMGLNTLSTNPDKLKTATLESARGLIDTFAQKQPPEIAWYDPANAENTRESS